MNHYTVTTDQEYLCVNEYGHRVKVVQKIDRNGRLYYLRRQVPGTRHFPISESRFDELLARLEVQS